MTIDYDIIIKKNMYDYITIVFLIVSLLAAVLYTLPSKHSKLSSICYTSLVGLGLFIVSLVFFFIIKPNEALILPFDILIKCILMGVLWMTGSYTLIQSIRYIGLTRSTQWKTLQGPIGTILGLIILNEYLEVYFVWVLIALVIVTLSAIILSIAKDTTIKDKNTIGGLFNALKLFLKFDDFNDKKGVVYSLITAVTFGIMVCIQKDVVNNGYVFSHIIYFAFIVFISALALVLIKEKGFSGFKPITLTSMSLPLLGGGIYYGFAICSTLAYTQLPLAIAFPILQLNGLILVLLGIYPYREVKLKENWLCIAIGIVLAVIGIYFLLLGKM